MGGRMPMLLPKYEQLPPNLQIPEVKPYYDSLKHKQGQLLCKRLFDLFAALVLLILLSPLFLGVAIWIKCDSSGPVFFRQTRITQFGKPFCILKFRTMVGSTGHFQGRRPGNKERKNSPQFPPGWTPPAAQHPVREDVPGWRPPGGSLLCAEIYSWNDGHPVAPGWRYFPGKHCLCQGSRTVNPYG